MTQVAVELGLGLIGDLTPVLSPRSWQCLGSMKSRDVDDTSNVSIHHVNGISETL